MTSNPFVSRTLATLRSAEFGFFGVVVYTRVHTPRRCGLPCRALDLVGFVFGLRPFRTSCWIVGTGWSYAGRQQRGGAGRRAKADQKYTPSHVPVQRSDRPKHHAKALHADLARFRVAYIGTQVYTD